MRRSIRQRLTLAFIGLAVGPLLLVGTILAWQSFTIQEQQALNLQHEVAQRVATQVTAFFEELENQLRVVSKVQGLQGLDRERQRSVLSELLLYQDVLDALILLDSEGQEQIHLSRLSLASTDLGNRAEADEFVVPQTSGEVYYSPIRFEETTGEPLMTIAIPLVDARTGLVDAVLVSEVRVKRIWDLIADVRVSEGQSVYIVDTQGRVVAHRNPSVVLRGTSFEVPDREGVQPGLTSTTTVLAVKTARFGQQEFNIVAEQVVSEALALAVNSLYLIAAVIVVALVVAGGLGLLSVRQIVQPIETLATTAQAISAGDLSQQAAVTRRDEIGALAQAFNSMTAQLRELIAGLEQQVADRKRAEEQLARQAQALDAELERMFYVASHHLQEPLRLVVSYSQLLKQRYRSKLDKDADEFINYAVRGATRIQALINDMLAFSRIGARQEPFEPVASSLILDRVLTYLKFPIEQSGAVVTRDPLPIVIADEAQLTQLFQNLIDNAVKFHSDCPPEIHVSAEHNDDEWVFSVRDNGIGIEPQYSDRIFQIFQQLHSQDEYPGTGIGLAICRKIVERHGGRTWVESEPGKGSTFYFTIPDRGGRPS